MQGTKKPVLNRLPLAGTQPNPLASFENKRGVKLRQGTNQALVATGCAHYSRPMSEPDDSGTPPV